jgi:hypothetical protein
MNKRASVNEELNAADMASDGKASSRKYYQTKLDIPSKDLQNKKVGFAYQHSRPRSTHRDENSLSPINQKRDEDSSQIMKTQYYNNPHAYENDCGKMMDNSCLNSIGLPINSNGFNVDTNMTEH